MLNAKDMNRFYVSSDNISKPISMGHNAAWTRKNLEEAVEHAKQLLAEDSRKQCVAIVEITHIVTRQNLPIKVTKVKR